MPTLRCVHALLRVAGGNWPDDDLAVPSSTGSPLISLLCDWPFLVETVLTIEPDLSAEEFIDVLQRSTLAERRPVDDVPRIEGMLRNASVIVAARDGDGLLVGVARAISDFSYCTYLADLAVDRAFQGRGIGRRLSEETHRVAGRSTTLILLSAPAARTYYPHIGMEQHDSCWIVRPDG